MSTSGRFELLIHDDDAGRRIDRVLRRLLPTLPLPEIFRLLRKGAIRIDGAKVEPSFRPGPGARLTLPSALRGDLDRSAAAPRPAPAARAEGRRHALPPPPVVYRDAHLLVVDKPAGVAVQPGRAGTADGEDHLLARCAPLLPAVDGAPRAFRPAPAHRIDRGTSGLVVIGISGPGLRGMVEAFRERRVAKAYLAVVAREALRGREEGVVDLPLAARAARGGGRIAVVADRAEGGRQARTLWRVEAVAGALALLRVELDASGRTHQIRAHLAAVGMPLVGDRRYGGPAGPRPLLHAWRLGFVHPVPDAEGVGQQLDLVAEPPSDLRVR